MRVRTALAALVATVVVAAGGVVGVATPAMAAGGTAVVVIDTGGSVRSVEIPVSGTITGMQALSLAGANPATYGFSGQGLAVCALDGVGHPATGDACLGTPDDPRYWAYFRGTAGSTGWSYSRGGAGGASVGAGDVEGWRFGTGAAPRLGVCDVTDCAPPAPAAGPGQAPAADSGGGTGAPAGGTSAAGGAVAPVGAAGPGVTPPTPGDPTPPETAPPATAPAPTADGPAIGNGRSRGPGTRALGPLSPGSDDGGSGSPVGVLAVAGIVLAIGGAAVVLRRRGRPSG